jgi:hypothetical protein
VDQDEEGGLEGVLHILPLAKRPSADSQDRGAVPADEHLEGCLVPLLDELPQQVRVRRTTGRL